MIAYSFYDGEPQLKQTLRGNSGEKNATKRPPLSSVRKLVEHPSFKRRRTVSIWRDTRRQLYPQTTCEVKKGNCTSFTSEVSTESKLSRVKLNPLKFDLHQTLR